MVICRAPAVVVWIRAEVVNLPDFICEECKKAADFDNMELHKLCKGASWCDCQHMPKKGSK